MQRLWPQECNRNGHEKKKAKTNGRKEAQKAQKKNERVRTGQNALLFFPIFLLCFFAAIPLFPFLRSFTNMWRHQHSTVSLSHFSHQNQRIALLVVQ